MTKTNIDWIGDIPTGWKLERLQWHLSEIKENNNPEKTKQILSLTNSRGVIPYEEKGAQGNNAKEDYTQYKLAYPNTIVANSMNVLIGSVGKCDYFGCVSPVYYVFKPNEGENIDYLNFIFQTQQFQKELRKYANGILEIRLRVSSDDILKRYVPIPPVSEQQKIVDAIKNEQIKIDNLIKIQEQQIEKLDLYKKQLITDCVKYGLNDSAKIDSSIKWIGMMSAGNKVYRVKNCYSLCGRIGWQGLTTSDYTEIGPYLITGTDFDNGVINWNTCVHITEERYAEDENIHVNEGDLLITKDGTIGKVAVCRNSPEKVSLNSGVMLLKPINDVCNPEYMKYVLWSDIFWDWYNSNQRGSSTIKHLYQEQFYYFSFPIPSINEQAKIVRVLDEKCKKVNELIKIKQQKIERLQEYKKSLIYEYVTGKKRVM